MDVAQRLADGAGARRMRPSAAVRGLLTGVPAGLEAVDMGYRIRL